MALFEDEDARNSGTLSEDLTKVLYTKRTERPDKKEWDERVNDRTTPRTLKAKLMMIGGGYRRFDGWRC